LITWVNTEHGLALFSRYRSFGPEPPKSSSYFMLVLFDPPRTEEHIVSSSRRSSLSAVALIPLGLAVLAVLAACTSSSTPDATASASDPATSVSSPSTPGDSPTTGPAASSPVTDPATSAPAIATTVAAPANYHAIAEDATKEKGLDFGFLTKVTEKDGTVSIRFDRASFYTGAEAIKHNHGEAPNDDYFIENTNTALRSFALSAKASIQAENALRTDPSGVGREKLTIKQFVHNANAISDLNEGVPIWVRHAGGPNGPVTALAEQFLP
jgi:hypothetical protein